MDGPGCANDEDSPMGGGWVDRCVPPFLRGARLGLVYSRGSRLLPKWMSFGPLRDRCRPTAARASGEG